MQLWRKLQRGDFSFGVVALVLVLAFVCHTLPFALLTIEAQKSLRFLLMAASFVTSAAVAGLLVSVRARLNLVQEAIDATHAAFAVYDAKDRLVIANKVYHENLGVPARLFVPGVHYADLMRASLARTHPGQPVEEELRRRLRLQQIADGTPSDRQYAGARWMRVTKTRTARGSNVGIAVDVSENYRLLERLEMEVARFSALAHSAPIGICQVTADGALRFANDPFLAMFDAGSIDELLGSRSLADVAGDPAPVAELLKDLTGFPNDGEMELVTGNERRDYIVRKAFVPLAKPSGDTSRSDGTAGESIFIFIDITERKRSAARLKHLALHDVLTGALNRIAFADDLAAAVATADATRPASLIAIDLDRFKPVNDLYGHIAGDELLRQVVTRIDAILPEGFHVYRTGGDEFCVLGSASCRASVTQLAERILASLLLAFDVRGHRVTIGGSVGISLLPDDARTAEALMHYADLAMYHVKESGGGRVASFDDGVLFSVNSRRLLESDLAAALKAKELTLVFQPLFGRDRSRPLGAEALVRWHNLRLGRSVSPATFVPVAEETGLIRDMDLQMFALATAELARWCAAGTAPEMLTVNMSTRTLETADVVVPILEALRTAGVDSGRIVIEVTESFAVRDAADLCRTIRLLAQHGLRFAIDDFGTGYTSFRLLADLPIHFIKIDRSFVNDLTLANSRSRAIIQSILNVARDLRLEVIAEGVETEAQYRALQGLGVSLFQGYLLGMPQPGADIAALLHAADPAIA